MTWGLVAVGGATLIGSVIGSGASSSAADSQADSASQASAANTAMQQKAIDAQREMFDIQNNMTSPWREAGKVGLESLQSLSTDQGRADALSGYYAGDEYASQFGQMSDEITGNLSAQAAATGGLRGGNYQQLSADTIGSLSNQMGQNYLTNMYNQNTGLANMGIGATSQGVQAAGDLGQGLASSYGQIGAGQAAAYNAAGQAQAQNQLTQGSIWGNAVGTLGGIGYNYFGG